MFLCSRHWSQPYGLLSDPHAGSDLYRLLVGAYHHDRRRNLHHDHRSHGDGGHSEGGLLQAHHLLHHVGLQLLHTHGRGHRFYQESVEQSSSFSNDKTV